MATIDTYKLKVQVDGKKELNDLKSSLSGLGGLIAGLGLVAFTRNLLQMADAMNDVAKSTGFALDYIGDLAYALEASGGKFNDAGKALQQFGEKMFMFKQGSQEVEIALKKLGITADDVRNSTEQELFETVLERLAQMPASIDRTATAVKILGESFKTVDPKTFLEELRKGAGPAGNDLRKLAEFNDMLERSFRQIQTAAVSFFARFTGDSKSFNINIEKAVRAMEALAAIIVLAFSAKVAQSIYNVVKAIIALTTATRTAIAAQTAFNLLTGPRGWALIAGAIAGTTTAMIGLNAVINNSSGSVGNLNNGLGQQTDHLERLRQAYARLLKLQEDTSVSQDTLKVGMEALAKEAEKYGLTIDQIRQAQGLFLEQQKQGAGAGDTFTSFSEQATRNALAQVEALKKRNQAQEEFLKKVKDSTFLSTREGQIAVANAQRTLQLQTDLLNIDQQIEQERSKGQKSVQGVIVALERQKELLQEAYQVSASYAQLQEKIAGYQDNVARRTQATLSLENLLFDLERERVNQQDYRNQAAAGGIKFAQEEVDLMKEILSLAQDRTKAVSQYTAEINKVLSNLAKINEETGQIELLPEFDVAQEQIKEFINQLVAQGEAFKGIDPLGFSGSFQTALQERLRLVQDFQEQLAELVGTERAGEIAHIVQMMALEEERYARLVELRKQAYEDEMEKQQDIRRGMRDAMEDLAKQFEPYEMAQQAVKDAWGTISDAVDTFVETGKFSFKEFARSILADLAKMIVKALLFKYIFGPLMGFFGLPAGGGVGTRAMGGPVDKGKPYIVGEKGPELFVPQGAGTIIPNNKLSTGAAPATREVSAPVTNNYITNNINAVDARSVAALFAENRKTLLGSVEMAKREMPFGVR